MNLTRTRFEAHVGVGWTPTQRRIFFKLAEVPALAYADPGVQRLWEEWQAAQPKFDTRAATAYLKKLASEAHLDTPTRHRLNGARRVMRILTNDNPELL